jgi:GT2 family glycosyltransferase
MITHVISTYNSIEFLKLAIKSVRQNSYYKDAPFIVFADGCTDGTDEWLKDNEKTYNLTLIIEPRCENSSNGYGMNRAAEFVTTEYINFIHADMYVAPNFDKALLEQIQAYPEDTRAIISSYRIQPNIFYNGKESDRPGTVMVDPELYGVMTETFKAALFEKDAIQFQIDYKDLEFPKAEGCSFIIRKRDWDFIGGNDLRFKPNGYDDMDLFLRMRNAGFKYKVIGASCVFHFTARGGNGYYGKGLDKRNESNAQGESKSGLEFYKKWNGMPYEDEYSMIAGVK